MKRNIIFRAAAVFTAMILLIQFVSCESYPRKILSDKYSGKDNSIVLLKNGDKRCNLSVSDDVMAHLQSNKQDLLNKLSVYFNILSDDSVDSNIIYINSRISKYMEGFTAYDENTYIEAKKNLKMDVFNNLKYRDYYVTVDDKCLLVVCGSASIIYDILQTLYDQYISTGKEKNNEYIMTVPREGIYNGSYRKGVGIAGNPIREYTIIYPSLVYSSEGSVAAKYLYDYLYENCGVDLPLKFNGMSMEQEYQYEIIVGKTSKNISSNYYASNPEIGAYKILQSGNKLYIMGGSDWAMQYAIDIIIRNYFSHGLSIPENYTISGTIYGEYLFEKYSGADLRIISQNIWNNDNNSPVWSAAGLDCSLSARLKSYSSVFMAYNPDIICFQEVKHIDKVNELLDMMSKKGRNYALIDCGKSVNYTPLAYDTDTLTLLDCGHHKFNYASDSYSKSYTWGYFKHNETGETFVVISIHLWWKSSSKNKRNSEYRRMQFNEISEQCDKLIQKYNCPCFVAGDFNCRSSSTEYKSSLSLGFSDCYDIATEFSDNSSGLFSCNSFVYSNQPKVGSYTSAIDHAVVKNIGDSKVISYDYISPNFYGKLSDHSPLCVDISL